MRSSMPRRMRSFYLDDDLIDGLRAIHDRDGVLPSEQVRRAIRAWLDSKDHQFAAKTKPPLKKGGRKK